MGAFDNINVASLKITFAKLNNVNCRKLENLKGDIVPSDWTGSSRQSVVAAIDSLISEYEIVQNKIKSFTGVADLIQDYKQIELENEVISFKIQSSKTLLQLCDIADIEKTGKLKSKLNEYNNKLKSNNDRKKAILQQINGIVG